MFGILIHYGCMTCRCTGYTEAAASVAVVELRKLGIRCELILSAGSP